MREVRVAVVILNFNGKKFLETFLPRVISHSRPHQVVVADNGSTDGSLPFLRQAFPEVTLLENGVNNGYAAGYNTALRNTPADYYILLNSDVDVTEHWIDPVIRFMEARPGVAACQPKIMDYHQPERFEYAGAAGGFIDAYGYPFCRGRLFHSLEEDQGQYDDTREIFWASGACLFVRAEAFHRAGGFDGDYFAHMEEIDLCWRLKNLGYQIYVVPGSVVYHIGGGTLNKLSSRKTFLNFRNNLSTLTKNHPGRFLLPKILFRLVLDGVAGCKFLAEGQPSHCLAVIRAHFSYYAWLPRLIAARRAMKKKPGFRFSEAPVYRKNIVSSYFLKGKKRFSELSPSLFSGTPANNKT
jgi:GT2 family glycosyltransferase